MADTLNVSNTAAAEDKLSLLLNNLPNLLSVIESSPLISTNQIPQYSEILKDILKIADESSLYPKNKLALIQNILKLVVESLGPHCELLPPDEFNEYYSKFRTNEPCCGVGMGICTRDGLIRVTHLYDGAAKSSNKIQVGDIIYSAGNNRFDKTPVSAGNVVKEIRGPESSQVMLGLIDIHTGEPKLCTLNRSPIITSEIQSRIVKRDIGYISIADINFGCASRFRDSISKLISSQSHPTKGLILDLRNCGGGLYSESINIASFFLESGIVAHFVENSVIHESHVTESSFKVLATPLIVLVNCGTASGAEIIASALRLHNRATLVGEKTFGKGSMQELLDISGGYKLKVTSGAWLTANRKSVEPFGQMPDEMCSGTPIINGQKIYSGSSKFSAVDNYILREDPIPTFSFAEAVKYAQAEFKENPELFGSAIRLDDDQWLYSDKAFSKAYEILTRTSTTIPSGTLRS
jgi:carboxyl-terminal processing protease